MNVGGWLWVGGDSGRVVKRFVSVILCGQNIVQRLKLGPSITKFASEFCIQTSV